MSFLDLLGIFDLKGVVGGLVSVHALVASREGNLADDSWVQSVQ